MKMRILEKRSKKQIILIPESQVEKNLLKEIPESKINNMKVSKGTMNISDAFSDKENVIVLTEQH